MVWSMPSLNYNQQFQQHLNWCWAAVSVSVERFYNPAATRTQCQLVNLELGRHDCCGFTFPWHPCNSAYSLTTALTTVGHLQQALAQSVTFAQSRGQIDANHPFGIRVAWLLGGAHFIACSGYYRTLVGDFLLVKDPTFGPSLVPFAIFPTLYWGSLGTWTHTYYTN